MRESPGCFGGAEPNTVHWSSLCMVVIASGDIVKTNQEAIDNMLDAQKEAIEMLESDPATAAKHITDDFITEDTLTVNPFVSYQRKIGRITWVAQVNVNNVFEKITDQGAQYRYPRFTEPRQFIYTLSAHY